MSDLGTLRSAAAMLNIVFQDTIERKFPGRDKWDWFRACAAISGGIGRRNDDQSQDAALHADPEIRAAYDAYIKALHQFYTARDGAGGVLGRFPAVRKPQ